MPPRRNIEHALSRDVTQTSSGAPARHKWTVSDVRPVLGLLTRQGVHYYDDRLLPIRVGPGPGMRLYDPEIVMRVAEELRELKRQR